jgi:hypothetical protein
MHALRSGLQLEARPGRTGASINHHTEESEMPRNQQDSKDIDNGNRTKVGSSAAQRSTE